MSIEVSRTKKKYFFWFKIKTKTFIKKHFSFLIYFKKILKISSNLKVSGAHKFKHVLYLTENRHLCPKHRTLGVSGSSVCNLKHQCVMKLHVRPLDPHPPKNKKTAMLI